jgi:hypothetical protein
MEVVVISLTAKGREKRDWRDILTIEVDGKLVFDVYDGEPEDANLARDFNDCLRIPQLMKMAHAAGKSGEQLSVEYSKIDEA